MIRLLLLALLAASSTASAIGIRDDVDDSKYRVPSSEFPALVDMPGEGHGVLIAPQWVITAAHAITWQSEIKQVVINGISRDVERLVIHPGYKTPPQELINQAMASGEAILLLVPLASSDDIALVKLAQPVTDVAPVAIYTNSDEPGQIVKIVGKGATGTGATGHDPKGPNRTELRRAFNKITSAYDRWFCYVFDEPPSALPLEGITGNGDSGGPALIQVDDQWLLAGLAAWKFFQGNVMTSRPGRYGQTSCNVRLSHYVEWIESVISVQPQACASTSNTHADDAGTAIRAADAVLQKALADRNLEQIVSFYADDAVLLPTAEPIVVGKAEIRKEWAHILAIPNFQNKSETTKIDVSSSGDMAYSMGSYVATMMGEDGNLATEPGKWLSVWKRQADGSWRIVADTYNTDIPPPDHK